MQYLIYASHAKYPWDESSLKELIQVSVENNRKNSITGMLIFLNNTFIQLLEGPHQAVVDTFDVIERDPRHEQIKVLLEGQIEKRNFNNWYMGFKLLSNEEFNNFSGFSSMDELFLDDKINNQSHPALIFLKLFYKKNYRDFNLETSD